MKRPDFNQSAFHQLCAMALAASLILPAGTQAATTTLATSPLATSTTSSVLPNLMFVLDDSGSMDWDYLPDAARNFSKHYGFNTSHCNGVYYNPNITYTPPVDSNGVSFSNTASSKYLNNTFTAAYVDGYNPSAGTFNLNTDFTGGSGSGSSGFSSYSGPAFYYTYTGTQTSAAQMNANKTSSQYYTECASGTLPTTAGAGPIPGNSIFTLTTLASTETVNITISLPGSPTTTNTVSSITVNNINIMSGSAASGTSSTPANNISALASNIAAAINLGGGGYSATAGTGSASNVVTITGPASAMGFTPVITQSGNWNFGTYQFPDTDPVKLQNFANWYTYYSHRMLMMKTGVGLAFEPLDKSYRVGYMTMNNNNWNGTINDPSADFVDIAPFDSTQKAAWYNKLYVANPGSSTPLRAALSNVGRLYAKKYAPRTVTTATITVTTGTGSATTVSSITVNGVEIMGNSASSTSRRKNSTSILANSIASAINAPAVTEYGATVSGSTVTITGPNSVAGATPIITYSSGGMIPIATSFVSTQVSANLNGVTPNDPIQYSCQQNFVILSTDGYWNGNNTYDLSNPPQNVGEQDGALARPKYDGATGVTTVTTNYARTYQTASTASCPVGQAQITTLQQTETCTTTITNGVAAPESCPSSWTNGTSSTTACAISSVQSPNPSNPQVVSQTTSSSTTGGTSNTLADVASYYYTNDLRTPALNNCDGALGTTASTGIDVCPNNVPKTDVDNNTAQHMSTFTLGLGASGDMQYSPTYQNDSSGDYYAVANGLTADSTASPPICSWQSNGTVCNWPVPSSGSPTTIDDLWHAAVDGGGTYFSATDPASLASGLSGALASIASRTGSAAAAATSTLNPVAGNNYAYVASYTTVKWQGNLEARTINVNTGQVSTSPSWCVENIVAGTCPSPGVIVANNSGSSTTYSCVTTNSTASTCASPGVFDSSTNQCSFPMGTACIGTMPALVGASSDTRTIYTANGTATAFTPFLYANLTATQQADFSSPYINGLSQWSSLTSIQQTAAQGANLVNYLRGQYNHDTRPANYVPPFDNRLFRYREATMGDALESQPNFIAAPVFNYVDPGYSAFKTAEASRPGTVYIGTNDGMLHAFQALAEGSNPAGKERWAYVPSMVIPNMWRLADTNYANLHTNYVNGSPVISDICTAYCDGVSGTPVWKTILVGGLNQGGRGYYAMDITDPTAPKLLWEFTTTAGIGSTQDDDLGYTYGNPVITAKADGTWVVLVTSGYNNVNPGSGQGFLFVLNANTGAIISKIATGAGTTTTPSGLSKISAWNDVPSSNRATYVYGGDLLGNVWRFNINDTTPAAIGTGSVLDFAILDDPSGNPQPITTSPVLGKISGYRVIFVGTGQYLGTPDLSTTQVQTEYAIKDDNATTTLVNPGGSPRTSTTLVQQTLTTSNGVRYASNNPVDFTTGLGWYVDFPDSGERVNIDGKLVQGTLLIATIVPSNTVCAPGGYGWLNYFNYQTGSSVNNSGIVSSSYSNTIVGINVIYINGSPIVEAVTSNDPTPTINSNVLINGTASGFTGQRVLWRELNP